MKRLFVCLLAILLLSLSIGCNRKVAENGSTDNSKTEESSTTILCAGETFVLNSVNKTSFSSGLNRNSYTAKIPSGTRFLVVRVQVDNKDTEAKLAGSANLLGSIAASRMDSDLKLAGGMAVVALMPPLTGKYCDFFIFANRQNFKGFMERGVLTNWADNWQSLDEPYRKLNTQSFSLVVDTKDLDDKDNIYLGFLNHNLTNACRIFLDIVAVK